MEPSGCGMPTRACRSAQHSCTAGRCSALAFDADNRRLATASRTDWHDAGECRRRSAEMWSRLRAGCASTTELEFDEGDAIHRLDQLAVWDLRRRLQELGGAPVK